MNSLLSFITTCLKKIPYVIALAAVSFTIAYIPLGHALGMTSADLNAVRNGTAFYDPADNRCALNGATTGSTSSGTPSANVGSFVDKYGQMAYTNSINTGVPYEFTLGQAIVESGYGGSSLSATYNNFFGIKATSDWHGKTVSFPTKEFENGAYVTINATFRAYDTAQDGFADHDAFLHDNSRYAPAFQHSNDPIAFLDAVADAGYATDPAYKTTVGGVIQSVQQYIASKNLWPPSSAITYNVTTPDASDGSAASSGADGCQCTTSTTTAPITSLDVSLVPQPYNEIFALAGNKYSVAPAFIAAIFYGGEHGNSFPNPPPPYGSGPAWAGSGAHAQGPFQFLASTWDQYGVDGNGDSKSDVNDLTDAAFGAANYFANGFHVANTTDEQKLRQAAADYNGIHDPNSAYSNNVWAAFVKFSGTTTSFTTASSTSACPSASTGADTTGYQNPYRDVQGLTAMRIDEGVDYGGSGPIYAIGNGVVTEAENGNAVWPGGNFVAYKLSDGPAQGKEVYFAENCPLAVTTGQQVTSSTVICNLKNGYPFSESGWKDPTASQTALAWYVYRPDGTATAYGYNFNQFLIKLGVPSGTFQYSNQAGGTNLTGSLPPDWPKW